MKDDKRFIRAIWASALLVGLTVLFNSAFEGVLQEMVSYAKRRIYYERVLSKKGLDLHKGQYWKEEP